MGLTQLCKVFVGFGQLLPRRLKLLFQVGNSLSLFDFELLLVFDFVSNLGLASGQVNRSLFPRLVEESFELLYPEVHLGEVG
jgi:hypothetical protein